MIVQQKIYVTWNTMNKEHLISKGYEFTKMKDKILINVSDLSLGSKQKVLCKCDYCGIEMLKQYKTVNPNRIAKFKYELKDCCSKCQPLKSKDQYIEKYGVNSNRYLQESEIKRKNTNLNRYGYENPAKNKIIKDKIKQTFITNYGYDNPMKHQLIKQKVFNTNFKKYGVKVFSQSHKYKEIFRKSCIEKYGQSHFMKVPEIKNEIVKKMIITKYKNQTHNCSNKQRKLWEKIGGELNYPISRCLLDIAFTNEMIYVEYDGGGHELRVIKGDISKNEFKQQEIKRDRFLRSLGWKIIRIKDNNDIMNENEIIDVINFCKNKLINNDIYWCEIDIFNKIIKTKNEKFTFDKGEIKYENMYV